ncbi:hypothetical protein [Corynebacterium efficiens]|uniref:Uncharacterized protein n=1 Tax=Corynebacterium efficiens (strain DSM 44549 / YS-314 / AJ 12310 / JCM 11189 / NBRC 100395) TaxID=196164 RepID=Q8FQA2_COREF|nr:hypothetical protein [Corynebacterium efficiens]BAC18029.1 hypothetical protein [Corynebacterium efficiens YS-314]
MSVKEKAAPGDLIFQWMCALQQGSFSQIATAFRWLLPSHGEILGRKQVNYWFAALEALGHCQIDWHERTWEINSARIFRVPHSNGVFGLAGYRVPNWKSVLRGLKIDLIEMDLEYVSGLPLPTTLLVQLTGKEEIENLRRETGAKLLGTAAITMSEGLRFTNRAIEEASDPPAYNSEIDRFNATRNFKWDRVSTPVSLLESGFYRVVQYGQPLYWTRKEDSWVRTTLPEGQFREFRRLGVDPFAVEFNKHRENNCEVSLANSVHLPKIHEQILVFCSGRLPVFNSKARGEKTYSNVPTRVFTNVMLNLLNN